MEIKSLAHLTINLFQKSFTGHLLICLCLSVLVSLDVLYAEPKPKEQDASQTTQDNNDSDYFEMSDLDPVVVTGSKIEEKLSDAATQVEVITRKDIDATPAENAADLLEEQPGVQVTRSFRGAGVRIQGFDSKHILILVDGERQIGRIDGVIDLNRIPVDIIEQIEIVKGPSSPLYGSEAMGGVINIITRKEANKNSQSLRASYGSFSAVDTMAKIAQGNSQLLINYNQREAFDWDNSDLATSGSAYNRWTANFKTFVAVNDRIKLDVRAEYSYTDLEGIDSSNSRLIFDRKNRRETALVSLKSQIKLKKRSAVNTYISHQIFRDQFVLDQRGSRTRDQDQETKEGLSQAGISFNDTLGQHIVSLGSEGLHQRLSTIRLKTGQNDRWRGSFFGQDEWLLPTPQPISIVSGVRMDLDSQFGHFLSPKFALRHDWSENVVTRFSYGMGYRAPVFKELYLFFENPSVGYVVEGNPDLQPETSHSYNLGIETVLGPILKVNLNGFYHDVSNLINAGLGELDPNGIRRFQYINIDRVRHQGIEVNSSLRLPAYLSFGLGYVLTSSQNVALRRQLTGRALHQGTVELKYHNIFTQTLVSLSTAWFSSRNFYADLDGDGIEETQRDDPYANVDLLFRQSVSSSLKCFISFENILNAGNHQFLAIQPFTVTGGINILNN